jgi:Fur family ferric uptake transcriptional regulator
MVQERSTRQRRAIAKALEDAGRPVTPEELLVLAGREVPRLGIATVYRAIRDLRAEGSVVAVEVAGHPTCFESAHHGHHHHFHCRLCRTVFEVHACASDIAAMAPKGFRLEDHEIVLRGLCSDCAAR